jgi:cell division protein FtsW
MRKLRSAQLSLDYDAPLLWASIALLLFGLVMVYSASIAIGDSGNAAHHQHSSYLARHALFIGIGVISGLVAFQVPMKTWQEVAPWLFLFGLALLILVLVPGIGRDVNGARRWLSLGPVNLQPSELMKLFVALYAADYTCRKMALMYSLTRGLAPMFFVMLLAGALLLREPDFGAFVVISAIAVGILFIGGMNVRWFTGLLVLLAVGFILLVMLSPYRRDRIFGFMDPWADAFGRGYQLTHSLIAFGRGSLFGVGLGGSIEKLNYLPEAHTDFLLAVIAEELGFAGVAVVLTLFIYLVVRMFIIARRAATLDRPFAAMATYGIALWIGVQSFINMGVNMGVLPTKGLTLPLMSYGGSGIVANCMALAIVLRTDWESRQLQRGLPA